MIPSCRTTPTPDVIGAWLLATTPGWVAGLAGGWLVTRWVQDLPGINPD